MMSRDIEKDTRIAPSTNKPKPQVPGFDSSEQKEKSQIPNTDGNDRTDIVKSSQLGFEVPEDEKG